jgi:hypothetical protein
MPDPATARLGTTRPHPQHRNTAGDLEIADPDEVDQYRHWADLLTEAEPAKTLRT